MAICRSCGDECEVIQVDDGIGAYEFWGAKGYHSDVHPASRCCEADYDEDGGVAADVTTRHTAIKDHVDGRGRIVVHKGRRYEKHYKRTYYTTEDGEQMGAVIIRKRELRSWQ